MVRKADSYKTPQARYDAANTVSVTLKLNRRTDADIIAALDAQPNRQGYIKQAIRDYERSITMIDMKYFEEAVQLMDDELREEIHADLAPCTQEEFLREYEKRHLEKYGEEFSL